MTPEEQTSYFDQWSLLDEILNYIQSLDVEDMGPNDVRLAIYHHIFDKRPLSREGI